MSLLRGLVLEDGTRWGDTAAGFQVEDAEAILEPGPDDPLMHFVTRPRGGSKTTDLAGMVLTALLELPAASRAYWIAADRDQGRLGVDALDGFIRRSGLSALLQVDMWKVTAVQSGSSVEVLAADAPGAFGLKSPLIVVDEFCQWPSGHVHQKVWEGLTSGMDKIAGARLVVITTAGDPASWTGKVYRHMLSSPSWRVAETPGPLPWSSRRFLEDQRGLLTDSAFARLHLNRWTASEDRLVSVEALASAVRLPGSLPYVPGWKYRLGLDVGITNDRCVVAVCHAETDDAAGRQRVILDHIKVWAGTKRRPVDLSEVEDTVAGLSEMYARPGRALVRADPFQAIGMAQRLRARGVPVEEWSFTAQRYANMAQTLYTLLRDGLLWIPDDPRLIEELSTVRLRETGSTGLLRVDHDSGAHDDQVVALGFAATACLEGGWVRRVLSAEERDANRRAARRAGRWKPASAGIMTREF